MSRMKKSMKIPLLMAIVTCIISISGSYAATNYAISASKIAYSDNSNLGVDNVQAAIDGTCTKFSNQLTNLKNEVKTETINEMYPIGSIYISKTLSTPTQVANAIGGTWQFFGNGKVLRSSSESSEQTGGASTVTLTTSNLPSHNHTFSGTTGVEINYNSTYGVAYLHGANYLNQGIGQSTPNSHPWATATNDGYSHKHNFSGTTSSTGDGKSFSVINPYITVYMYKRTA